MKIVLIDDSQETANDLSFAFKIRWPDAILVHTANESKGMEMVATESPDIVILDISLPNTHARIDGFEVLEQIRLFSEIPIIILSTRGDEMNKVRGLEAGADDYITKPFGILDLLARVQAKLRRTDMHYVERNLPLFTALNLTVDFSTREVSLVGKPVHLTPTEYRLLCHFVRNEGKVLTGQTLRRLVWDDSDDPDISILKKYVYQLRNKITDGSSENCLIVSERGMGYKFVGTRRSPRSPAKTSRGLDDLLPEIVPLPYLESGLSQELITSH